MLAKMHSAVCNPPKRAIKQGYVLFILDNLKIKTHLVSLNAILLG